MELLALINSGKQAKPVVQMVVNNFHKPTKHPKPNRGFPVLESRPRLLHHFLTKRPQNLFPASKNHLHPGLHFKCCNCYC